MNEKDISLTEAEWNVMECLWEKNEVTGRELTEELEEKRGWKRSTTFTLAKRLEEKGAVSVREDGNKKIYSPILSREDAALSETEELLDRVYHGSFSLLVSAFTKKQNLSKEEIKELKDLLLQMEEE